jgi:hypothetical protein
LTGSGKEAVTRPCCDDPLADLDHDRVEQLRRDYASELVVLLRELVSPDYAAKLLEATKDAPRRRVTCGASVSWDEQRFDSRHVAHQFFARPEFVALARNLSGLDQTDLKCCWTSCYRIGEFINSHRDGDGSIQLLICLKAPAGRENGGVLIVDGRELILAPGDAVAFAATRLDHYTTPLVATENDGDPQRVVVVARYG